MCSSSSRPSDASYRAALNARPAVRTRSTLRCLRAAASAPCRSAPFFHELTHPRRATVPLIDALGTSIRPAAPLPCMQLDSDGSAAAFRRCRSETSSIARRRTLGPRPERTRHRPRLGRSPPGASRRVAPCLPRVAGARRRGNVLVRAAEAGLWRFVRSCSMLAGYRAAASATPPRHSRARRRRGRRSRSSASPPGRRARRCRRGRRSPRPRV
jgi:hypothetical protein